MSAATSLNPAHREILWNITSPANQVVMYFLFALSMAVCAWGIWRRMQLWSLGKADNSRFGDYPRRFQILWDTVFSQSTVVREKAARIFHTFIVIGFLVLLFTTTMVMIDHDLGIKIYHGHFYLAVTVLSDIFGFFLLVGVSLAIYRRYVISPDLLHNSHGSFLMLLLLALLVVQGFILESLRIYVTSDPWAAYSPVGLLLSKLYWGIPHGGARFIHFVMWWFHTITVFLFFAILPYTKFLHIISSSANLFFSRLDRPKGALSNPGDIEEIMETALATDDGEFRIGAKALPDLTWKQRLDLDACTECGRCQNVCPAYNSGKVLSPKWLILDLRNHMLSLRASETAVDRPVSEPVGLVDVLNRVDSWLLSKVFGPLMDLSTGASHTHRNELRADNVLVQGAPIAIGKNVNDALAGEVLDEDVFWSCTTCRACMEACPVGIEHVDLIVDVRRSLALMDGNIPSEAQSSIRAIENRGNPYGPAEERASWAADLNVPMVKSGDSVEVLYWVGCVSAYDRRKQKIARSMVAILNASGIKWGILGNRESCTGDPARRLGEENLYQRQAKKNISLLKEISFQTVVANCPHCFNTIRNEYPQFDSSFLPQTVRVVHHSQFISELISEGRLAIREDPQAPTLTFHDPCYLGRYNDVYNEPREALVQIGSKVKEMSASKEKGLCCGAGGGHFWMDMKVGERVNVIRARQARETGTEMIATACPFCMQMMEDGTKLIDEEHPMEVRDIAELVAERLVTQALYA